MFILIYSLVLSSADFSMVWTCNGIPYFHFYVFVLFRTNDNCYGIYFEVATLNVTWSWLCSKFFVNNWKFHCYWHLKDTLQLNILRIWINIRANLFFGKNHETKVSSTKIRACLSMIIPARHSTYHFMPLFL